jgi:integrase
MARTKIDTRNLVKRGGVYYLRYMNRGAITSVSLGTGDLATAAAERDRLLAVNGLEDRRERLETIAVQIGGVDRAIEQIKDGVPHLTMLAAWQAFRDTPKGRNARGRAINPGTGSLRELESKWGAFVGWLDENHPTPKNEIGRPMPREVRNVTPTMGQEYIRHIEATRSPRTRNKVLTFLRMIFRIIGAEAGCKANPFDGLENISYAVAKKRGLTVEQLKALSKAVEGAGEMERLFCLGFHTGARLGDCCKLQWSDVDMDAGTLHYLPSKTRKTNADITLNLAPPLLANLQKTSTRDRKGPILPDLSALYRKNDYAVSKLVQEVFRKAGIEPSETVPGCAHKVGRYGFHSLRTVFITQALKNGAVIEDVRAAVGHADVTMTASYYRGGAAARNVGLIAMGASTDMGQARGALQTILEALPGLGAADLQAVIDRAREIQEGGKA